LFIPLFGLDRESEELVEESKKARIAVGSELSYEKTFPVPDKYFSVFSDGIMVIDPSHFHGRVPYKILPDHKVLLRDYEKHNFVIFKKYRQGGFTTFNLIYAIWKAVTGMDRRIVFVTKYDREAIGLSYIVKRMELGDLVERQTNHETTFANGSSICYMSASAGKGRSCNWLFIDEAAFFENMHDTWKCLYPSLSAGARCVVYSTPNGTDKNWFHQTYFDALKKRNSFHVSDVHYLHHPNYATEDKRRTYRENLGDKAYLQEVKAEFI
jgi:hypothetical protein